MRKSLHKKKTTFNWRPKRENLSHTPVLGCNSDSLAYYLWYSVDWISTHSGFMNLCFSHFHFGLKTTNQTILLRTNHRFAINLQIGILFRMYVLHLKRGCAEQGGKSVIMTVNLFMDGRQLCRTFESFYISIDRHYCFQPYWKYCNERIQTYGSTISIHIIGSKVFDFIQRNLRHCMKVADKLKI